MQRRVARELLVLVGIGFAFSIGGCEGDQSGLGGGIGIDMDSNGGTAGGGSGGSNVSGGSASGGSASGGSASGGSASGGSASGGSASGGSASGGSASGGSASGGSASGGSASGGSASGGSGGSASGGSGGSASGGSASGGSASGGSGGSASGGSGGSAKGGTGGTSSDVCAQGGTCDQLASEYARAVSIARQCTPKVQGQCGDKVLSSIPCGCEIPVNDGTQARTYYKNWSDTGCGKCPVFCPAVACVEIQNPHCVASVGGNQPGTGTCASLQIQAN